MGHQVTLSDEEALSIRLRRLGITQRQFEIVRGLALGKPRKQLASELGITCHTVDFHIHGNGATNQIGLKKRLGFSDLARITHWAIMNKIVKPGEPL